MAALYSRIRFSQSVTHRVGSDVDGTRMDANGKGLGKQPISISRIKDNDNNSKRSINNESSLFVVGDTDDDDDYVDHHDCDRRAAV